MKRRLPSIIKFPYRGKWRLFNTTGDAWNEAGESTRQDVVHVYQSYLENPLQYFLPHGIPWSAEERVFGDGALTVEPSEYPELWQNDGAAFINDRDSDISLMLGPNQCGKSVVGVAWCAYRLFPCDPEWDCFTRKLAPIKYYEWDGPKTFVVASYTWDNVQTVWDRVRTFFPQKELGEYRAFGPKNYRFSRGGGFILDLACGSRVKFLGYIQDQAHWEGFDCDGGMLDEQCPREKFIGLKRGVTTAPWWQFCMCLTGHVLEDRPDTGAAGWIKKGLYDHREAMGMKASVYHLSVETTPNSVIPAETKKQLHDQWVNPDKPRSTKDERAAVARYWGGWEEGSGRLFDADVWDAKIHLIDPIWDRPPGPEEATLYRVIDYGDVGITCCGWFAVTRNFAFLYRLLYEKNLLIAEAAKKIIDLSGNQQLFMHEADDPSTGNILKYYTEKHVKEVVFKTILDSRSMVQRQQGETIGDIFARYGIDVEPACGKKNDFQYSALKDWLKIDFGRTSPFTRKPGCPRLFVFRNSDTQALVHEIENLGCDPDDPTKINKKQAHHAIDVCKYWASQEGGPKFWGSEWLFPFDDGTEEGWEVLSPDS